MFYIGIYDNEPTFLQQVTTMTQKILAAEGIDFHIHPFRNTVVLEEYLHSPDKLLDLLFLDIIMDKRNGIEYAHELRRQGNDIPIIFIAATMDYALDGYTVDAMGYILKPIGRHKLREALLRVYKKIQKQTVVLTSASRAVSFRLGDVLYLEIQDKELSIHLIDGNILSISLPLNSLISRLSSEQFVQCYRSYIVSLSAIISVWRYGIELINHEKIPVSRKYYPVVQNALVDWARKNSHPGASSR